MDLLEDYFAQIIIIIIITIIITIINNTVEY